MVKRCEYCGSTNDVCRFNGGMLLCSKHYLQMYQYGELYEKRSRVKSSFDFVDGMLLITTSRGVNILADQGDYELLKEYSWCISKTGYAVANIACKVTKMHRYILHEPDGIIDHINGNQLDNRKHNLRVTTSSVNARNIRTQKNTMSGKIGVGLIKKTGRWRARIMVDWKEINLGYYVSYEDAVKARREAEMYYFGFYSRG